MPSLPKTCQIRVRSFCRGRLNAEQLGILAGGAEEGGSAEVALQFPTVAPPFLVTAAMDGAALVVNFGTLGLAHAKKWFEFLKDDAIVPPDFDPRRVAGDEVEAAGFFGGAEKFREDEFPVVKALLAGDAPGGADPGERDGEILHVELALHGSDEDEADINAAADLQHGEFLAAELLGIEHDGECGEPRIAPWQMRGVLQRPEPQGAPRIHDEPQPLEGAGSGLRAGLRGRGTGRAARGGSGRRCFSGRCH